LNLNVPRLKSAVGGANREEINLIDPALEAAHGEEASAV
jgi:hypothetical protein